MSHHSIVSKTICSVMGFFSGYSLTLSINWAHIYEKSVETFIVAGIGGVAGALGGLLIAFLIKKFNLGKYFHK